MARTRPSHTIRRCFFHLGHDPSEQSDVARNHAEVLADIAREVERHRAALVPGKAQLDEIISRN